MCRSIVDRSQSSESAAERGRTAERLADQHPHKRLGKRSRYGGGASADFTLYPAELASRDRRERVNGSKMGAFLGPKEVQALIIRR